MNKIYAQEFDEEMIKYSSSETIKKIVEYAEIPNDKVKEKNKLAADIADNLFYEATKISEFQILPHLNFSLFGVFFSLIEEGVLVNENLITASRLVGVATEGIGEFLKDIRYLGPLRAEPKAAYGSAYTTPNTPLGINGGSTAEYLHRSFIKNSSIVDDQNEVSLDIEAKSKLDHMVKTIGIGEPGDTGTCPSTFSSKWFIGNIGTT